MASKHKGAAMSDNIKFAAGMAIMLGGAASLAWTALVALS